MARRSSCSWPRKIMRGDGRLRQDWTGPIRASGALARGLAALDRLELGDKPADDAGDLAMHVRPPQRERHIGFDEAFRRTAIESAAAEVVAEERLRVV